jgi:hypothetical protein
MLNWRDEMMRTLIATLGIVGLLIQPISVMAQPMHVQGTVKTQRVYTEDDDVKEVLLLPVRLVAGTLTAPIGAIGGMAKRTGDSVEWVNKNTFRKVVNKHDKMTDKPGKVLGRGPVLVPVGIVGTAAALPLGASYGAVEGSVKGFTKGFNWPDKDD